MSEGERLAADPRVRRLLPPGDEIVWVGRPDPDVLFAPADALLVPLTCSGFLAGVVFSLTKAPQLLLFVLPVLGYLAAGRFVVKQRRKRRTTYAVTRSCALAITPGDVRRFPLDGGERRVQFDRGRNHVSVLFRCRPPRAWVNSQPVPVNTGLDVAPFGYAAWDGLVDVARPADLLVHLDDARRFRPAADLPPPRAEDAIGRP